MIREEFSVKITRRIGDSTCSGNILAHECPYCKQTFTKELQGIHYCTGEGGDVKTINLEDIRDQFEKYLEQKSKAHPIPNSVFRNLLREYFTAGFIQGRKNAIDSLP